MKKIMLEKINEKDKRALKIGAVCIAAIMVFLLAKSWIDHWSQIRTDLAELRNDLAFINPPEAKYQGLKMIVPVFEMPQNEKDQAFLFRDSFGKQLKDAGIKAGPLQFLPTIKSRVSPGYKLRRLRYKGKCQFAQMLDLLAGLKKNPYLVTIEEFELKCDQKNRQDIELDLVVSAFAR